MKTGKLITDPAHPYQNQDKGNFYNPVTFYKNAGKTGGNLHPQDKNNTRLQELSLMSNAYFGAIFNDI